MKSTMRLLLCFTTFFAALSARGDLPKEIKEILNQHARPTWDQLEPIFEKHGNQFSSRSHYDVVNSRLPEAIAAWELWFPGATWWELGRDAVFVGDILDAFYRSIGQKDRVKRLNASAPSFKHEDDEITNQFLRSSGLFAGDPRNKYPDVVFDITSFNALHGVGGGASQSVRVVRAGYSAYVKAGGKPRDLLKKFNFISIGGYQNPQPDAMSITFNPIDFLRKQGESVTELGFKFPFFFDLMGFTYAEAEWHGMFELFERRGNEVIGPMGAPRNESTKWAILNALYSVWTQMKGPAFLNAVELQAAKRGYVFPKQRGTPLVAASATLVEDLERASKAALQKHQQELKDKQAADGRRKLEQLGLSTRGIELYTRYETGLANRQTPEQAARSILEDLTQSQTKITDRDSEILLIRFLMSFPWYETREGNAFFQTIATQLAGPFNLHQRLKEGAFLSKDLATGDDVTLKRNRERLEKALPTVESPSTANPFKLNDLWVNILNKLDLTPRARNIFSEFVARVDSTEGKVRLAIQRMAEKSDQALTLYDTVYLFNLIIKWESLRSNDFDSYITLIAQAVPQIPLALEVLTEHLEVDRLFGRDADLQLRVKLVLAKFGEQNVGEEKSCAQETTSKKKKKKKKK